MYSFRLSFGQPYSGPGARSAQKPATLNQPRALWEIKGGALGWFGLVAIGASACAPYHHPIVDPAMSSQAAATSVPSDPSPLLEPDRPDITNGPHLVPTGSWQFELGAQYVRRDRRERAGGSPVQVRWGLADWVELRVSSDGFVSQHDSESSVGGIGNVQLGAKLRLRQDRRGAAWLSLLPTVNLPTASAEKGLGSGDPDFTLGLLTGADLPNGAHIDLNYAIGGIGGGADRPHFLQHFASGVFSVSVGARANPYVELFWFSHTSSDGDAALLADGGVMHLISSRVALDGGVAFGLTGAAPDFSVFGGITFLVRPIRGRNAMNRARAFKPARPARARWFQNDAWPKGDLKIAPTVLSPARTCRCEL